MSNPCTCHRLGHGIHRRTFLADMGMGFVGLALGAMLQRDGYASAGLAWTPPNGKPHASPKAKSVIWLFMNGGVSHMDAICHQACGLRLHGGLPIEEVETQAGFTRLGIETVPPLLRRGVLLDVAHWKGQDRLPLKYGITAEDLRGCAAAQRVEVRSGDVLVVRTGYAVLWKDEATYLDAAGVSKSGTLWAAERDVMAVGADNMAWDVPDERDPDTGATLFGHVHLLTQKGIYILENLNLDELSRDRRYVFAFIGIPLKLNGATGSPLRPLALV